MTIFADQRITTERDVNLNAVTPGFFETMGIKLLVMILPGISIGLPLVWVLGRLVESQLYQVKPWDAAVIAFAVLALCLAGLGAAPLYFLRVAPRA